MNDVNDVNEVNEVPKVKIKGGRMPLALVHVIRFSEKGTDNDGATNTELAAKYETTVGKITDIRAGHNFPYIVEASSFSELEIEAAKARSLGGPAEENVLEAIDELQIATDADMAERAELQKSSRKPKGAKPEVTEPESDKIDEPDEASDDELDDDDLNDLLD